MPAAGRIIGRYALHAELASGGAATVHLGRLLGPVGFARTVAIERLHPHFAVDPAVVAMFIDEARLAGRVRHRNVVPILDVVSSDGELFLVLEYVHGQSLARLLRAVSEQSGAVSPELAAGIMINVLDGLQAVHDATTDEGEPLEIVHRDVSPQNILVGADGLARVLDFGIAKAVDRIQTTRTGQLKGKAAYMAPEQLQGAPVDRRADLWAAAVVLSEMLTGRRLFDGVAARSRSSALDEVIVRGLMKDPAARFATAREMAVAVERAVAPASSRTIGDWVEATAGDALRRQARLVEAVERRSAGNKEPLSTVAGSETTVVGQGRPVAGAEPPAPAPHTPAVPVREKGRGRAIAGAATGAVVAFALAALARTAWAPTRTTDAGGPAAESASVAASATFEPGPLIPPSVSTRRPAPPVSSPSTPHRGRPVDDPCKPPYTVGPAPDFIRQPKPECFSR